MKMSHIFAKDFTNWSPCNRDVFNIADNLRTDLILYFETSKDRRDYSIKTYVTSIATRSSPLILQVKAQSDIDSETRIKRKRKRGIAREQ